MNTVPSARPATDCQVLVVGAGPTGLVLACELLARGIHTRIIDRGDAVALQARAIGVHARTLEVLAMMGLADRFLADGQVVRHMRFYSEGRCLATLEFARCGSAAGHGVRSQLAGLLPLPSSLSQCLSPGPRAAGR